MSADIPLLTIDDVMRRLQVSRSWCYQTKLLPWIKIGRHKRLRPQDLELFLASRWEARVMRQPKPEILSDPTQPMD